MRVFVTGAEGFIGSHVVEALVHAGHEVAAMVQYNSFNSAGWLADLGPEIKAGVRVVMGDVRDPGFMLDALKGQERVVHLAALIAIPYSYAAPMSYIETNVIGTANVMESCKRNGIHRVVHTSTSEVYGTAQYVPIDEKHPVVGQSPYSASKIGADQLAHSYWSSFGTPVVTLRPFNTYGPRQSQRAFIPSVMVQLLARENSLSLGSLRPTRDLTYVHDTARGFVAAVESDVGDGETFNLGSGFEISMKDLVQEISSITGIEMNVSVDQARIRPANSEVERLWSDSSKIFDKMGWAPALRGVQGLRAGLQETFEWFSENYSREGYDGHGYVR
jgi:dTDP-glucose 4,6-dehydratase